LQDWLNSQGCECSSDTRLSPESHKPGELLAKRQSAFDVNTSLKACNGVDKNSCETPISTSRLSDVSVNCSDQLSGTYPRCDTPRVDLKKGRPLLPKPVSYQQSGTSAKCNAPGVDQNKKSQPLLSIPVSNRHPQVNTFDLQKVPNVKEGQATETPLSTATSLVAIKRKAAPYSRCDSSVFTSKSSSASSSHLSSVNKISNSARKLATSRKQSQMTQNARKLCSPTNILPVNRTQFSTAQVAQAACSKSTLSGPQQNKTVQKVLDVTDSDTLIKASKYELRLTSQRKSPDITSGKFTASSPACCPSTLTSSRTKVFAQSAKSVLPDRLSHSSCSSDQHSKVSHSRLVYATFVLFQIL